MISFLSSFPVKKCQYQHRFDSWGFKRQLYWHATLQAKQNMATISALRTAELITSCNFENTTACVGATRRTASPLGSWSADVPLSSCSCSTERPWYSRTLATQISRHQLLRCLFVGAHQSRVAPVRVEI
jgi:hypothetical protein